ncbi:uncharacterized protein LOC115919847 [Strongylocentrotus purpuratus]|uniref:EDRF1 TPR repeats region domain-containing protein n=1 Tax=Strongylocentrotus purpuratus TaxID=7668 RepID=A0A7M7STK4_STRPU|nr:uncharacterized protein LOC115919847 [Strongylocentrotus purpuratus]
MACQMQDRPPVSRNLAEIEKDVLKFMSKAMALCDTKETSSSRQPLYQDRAATIHLRLASMNLNSMRNQNTKTMAKLHYNKAIKLFEEMDSPGELLRKELDRVALLLEHQVESLNSKQEEVSQEMKGKKIKEMCDGGQAPGQASSSSGAITNLGLQPDQGLSVAGATHGTHGTLSGFTTYETPRYSIKRSVANLPSNRTMSSSHNTNMMHSTVPLSSVETNAVATALATSAAMLTKSPHAMGSNSLSPENEEGSAIYFDDEKCGRWKMDGFTWEYSYLED